MQNAARPNALTPAGARLWRRIVVTGSLLVVVLVGTLAWSIHRQYAAIEAIQSEGGRIVFASTNEDWLHQVFPPDIVRAIRRAPSVEFSRRPSPEALDLLADLRGLESLTFNWTDFSDEDLEHLANLKGLRRLSIRWTSVEGPGLRHLDGMNSLEDLRVCWSRMGSDGLEHLPPLPSLRRLFAAHVRVPLIEVSRNSPFLEELELSNGGFDPEESAKLADLRELRSIHLFNTGVDDDCVERLSTLPMLARINLSYTRVTNTGAMRLLRLPHLQAVNLEGSRCTNAAMSTLRIKFPRLERMESITDRIYAGTMPPGEGEQPAE